MKENSIGDRIEEKYTRYINCETDILELTIEEAIFILEKDASVHYVEDLLQEAYKVILSDYKRVLKENELLRKDIESWKKYCEEIEEEQTEMSNKNCELEFEVEKLQKENEELKQDKNNNYQMIELAQNEVLGYMQGYEDGKKLKRSAVAYVVENQQYYIIKKEIEHYKEYIEKLQKENDKLKNQVKRQINAWNKDIKSNYISKHKIKDKIKELEKNTYTKETDIIVQELY